jgi:anti-anti-sigma regulatory factor
MIDTESAITVPDTTGSDTTGSDTTTVSVVTVSGSVGALDVPDLRDSLLSALDRNPGDVLLDMREAAEVDDLLMAALTATRSRAKHLRRRLVVIDTADGATALSLRRHGLHFRCPVYLDPASATAGLAADRASRGRLTLGGAAGVPADEPPGGPADVDAAERLAPPVHARQARWPVSREVRPTGL